MDLFVIRRRGVWATPKELQAAGPKSASVGDEMADRLRWIRSYVVEESDGRAVAGVCGERVHVATSGHDDGNRAEIDP